MELYTALYNTVLHHPPTKKTFSMDTKSVEIVPNKQVVLYKLNNSKNWHVRIKLPEEEGKGYWKKTTGTADFEQARIKAIGFYSRIYDEDSSIREVMLAGRLTVEKIANDFLDNARNINKNDKAIINNYIIPKLGKSRLSKLKNIDIQDYIDSCEIKSESTFANHRTTLNKLFRYALNNGDIKSIEHLTLNKRDFSKSFESKETDIITSNEWNNICRNFLLWSMEPKKKLSKMLRERLYYYIHVALFTGLRPGQEIEELELKDIEFTKYKDKTVGFINVRYGKKKDIKKRKIAFNEEAGEAILKLIELLYHENIDIHDSGSNDYEMDYFEDVFESGFGGSFNEETLFRFMERNPTKKLFYILEKKAEYTRNFTKYINELKDKGHINEDKNITLYSLRHTYITNELFKGRDIYEIAKHCGNSVQIIEKYYSKYESQIKANYIFDSGFHFYSLD